MTYWQKLQDPRWQKKRLVTVCAACHSARQAREDIAQKYLGWLFERLTPDVAARFIESLRRAAEQIEFPEVFDWEHVNHDNWRWFRYATEHPEARGFYESVLETTVDRQEAERVAASEVADSKARMETGDIF